MTVHYVSGARPISVTIWIALSNNYFNYVFMFKYKKHTYFNVKRNPINTYYYYYYYYYVFIAGNLRTHSKIEHKMSIGLIK